MSQKLGHKFYCYEQEIHEQYSQISEICKYTANNIYQARIFVKPKYVRLPEEKEDKNALRINLSAMCWANWNGSDEIVKKVSENYFRVCYATHNSREEIEDFLKYLKPKKIYFNVLPKSVKDQLEIKQMIREIQSTYMELDDEGEKPKKKFSFRRKNGGEQSEQVAKRSKTK
jgi:hypothetical protein